MGQNQSAEKVADDKSLPKPEFHHYQGHQTAEVNQKGLDPLQLIKSRSNGNLNSSNNPLSKSIPNLKDFKNLQQPHLEEGGKLSSRTPGTKYQSQMEQTNAEARYKKNLYSAMTTRVIKQQENAHNLNNSQILQLTSQRSMNHLNLMQNKNNQTPGSGSNTISFLKHATAAQSATLTPAIDNNLFNEAIGDQVSRNKYQQHNVIVSPQIHHTQIYSEQQAIRQKAVYGRTGPDIYQDKQFLSNSAISEYNQQRIHTQQLQIIKNQDMPRMYQPGAAPTLDFSSKPSEGIKNYNKPLSTQGIPSKQRPAHGVVLPSSSFSELDLQTKIIKNQRLTPNAQYMVSKMDKPVPSKDQQTLQQKMFQSQRTSLDYSGQIVQRKIETKPGSANVYQNFKYDQNIKNAGQQYLIPSQTPSIQNSAGRNSEHNNSMPPLPYKIRIKNTGDIQIGAASSRVIPQPMPGQQQQVPVIFNPSQRVSLYTATPIQNQSLLIKREIQFGGQNCPLDPRTVMILLLYDMPSFRKYLCLSPSWHRQVLDAMDDYFRPVETNFVMKNYEFLLFKKSYTNSSIIQFCGSKGIRVDRVLVCEVLDNAKIMNKCMRISYSYQYAYHNDESYIKKGNKGKNTKQTFVADFKLDVVKAAANRVLWVHKDEQEQFNLQKQYPSLGEELQEIICRPYVQPITQICAKDTIEIAINFYSLQGLVNIDSIEWIDCSFTVPSKYNVITYDKDAGKGDQNDMVQKIYCDMSRICELEDAVVEWYDSRYFQRQEQLLNIDFLNELFKITKYECAGIDGTICKIQLNAVRCGRMYNKMIGIPLVVKGSGGKSRSESIHFDSNQIVNEVKKLGLLIDRYVDLELRIGDTLVIYISRGGQM